MKPLLSSLCVIFPLAGAAIAGNFFGPAPFANGAPYAGYLNGKYMGVVTGADGLTGVLGFGISDGAPPFRVTDQQNAVGDIDPAVVINQTISPDTLQNYFAIFVAGRTYTGTTVAGIDIESNTVAGALQGQNPVGLLSITASETFAAGDNAAADALNIVNRGLSGGFTAQIESKQATFTFSGTGQLNTPANAQTIEISADVIAVEDPVGPPPRPAGVITNESISGVIISGPSTDFDLRGIRTSFASSNPAAQQDALQFNQGAQ